MRLHTHAQPHFNYKGLHLNACDCWVSYNTYLLLLLLHYDIAVFIAAGDNVLVFGLISFKNPTQTHLRVTRGKKCQHLCMWCYQRVKPELIQFIIFDKASFVLPYTKLHTLMSDAGDVTSCWHFSYVVLFYLC